MQSGVLKERNADDSSITRMRRLNKEFYEIHDFVHKVFCLKKLKLIENLVGNENVDPEIARANVESDHSRTARYEIRRHFAPFHHPVSGKIPF
jgi:hypothetical protein